MSPAVEPLPTLMVLPSLTPTEKPPASATPVLATRAVRALPSPLPSSTQRPATITPLPTTTALPPTPTPLAAASPQPSATEPQPSTLSPSLYTEFTFGTSVEGRDLRGYRIGTGTKILLLVGAIHGGFEANSAELIDLLAAHFRDTPSDILPDITLLLIPALNPDGLSRGRVLEGRFNANSVDLNRNWACGWSPVAYFRDQTVSAGSSAFSEPETQALSALIQQVQPSAVLFYHAAASGVYSGDCGGDFGSGGLSETYGRAAEYDFGGDFSAYPVTGTAPAWVNSLGIPSADVELASSTDPEFERNLRGVMAVQYWLAPPAD